MGRRCRQRLFKWNVGSKNPSSSESVFNLLPMSAIRVGCRPGSLNLPSVSHGSGKGRKMFTRFSSTLRNSGKAAAFICLALLLPNSSAYAADVDALPDVADEVINVIGNLPTYHNRTVGGVTQVDRKDATFTVSIDFNATTDSVAICGSSSGRPAAAASGAGGRSTITSYCSKRFS